MSVWYSTDGTKGMGIMAIVLGLANRIKEGAFEIVIIGCRKTMNKNKDTILIFDIGG